MNINPMVRFEIVILFQRRADSHSYFQLRSKVPRGRSRVGAQAAIIDPSVSAAVLFVPTELTRFHRYPPVSPPQ